MQLRDSAQRVDRVGPGPVVRDGRARVEEEARDGVVRAVLTHVMREERAELLGRPRREVVRRQETRLPQDGVEVALVLRRERRLRAQPLEHVREQRTLGGHEPPARVTRGVRAPRVVHVPFRETPHQVHVPRGGGAVETLAGALQLEHLPEPVLGVVLVDAAVAKDASSAQCAHLVRRAPRVVRGVVMESQSVPSLVFVQLHVYVVVQRAPSRALARVALRRARGSGLLAGGLAHAEVSERELAPHALGPRHLPHGARRRHRRDDISGVQIQENLLQTLPRERLQRRRHVARARLGIWEPCAVGGASD